MVNGAGHFLQCTLILKCIIIGLLKIVCLYREYRPSVRPLNSVLTRRILHPRQVGTHIGEGKVIQINCTNAREVNLDIDTSACHTFSNWHSGFTFASLCFEVISVWLVCSSEDARHRLQKDDVDAVVGTNIFGFILKCIATLNTYYKELEEIKAMCSLCTVMEIGLDVLICCCYCCFDEPRQNSTKIKLPA